MLDELLAREQQPQETPEQDVVNMQQKSKYLAMMNSLKQKIGKARKSEVDAEIANKEAQIAIQEAQAQGMGQ